MKKSVYFIIISLWGIYKFLPQIATFVNDIGDSHLSENILHLEYNHSLGVKTEYCMFSKEVLYNKCSSQGEFKRYFENLEWSKNKY